MTSSIGNDQLPLAVIEKSRWHNSETGICPGGGLVFHGLRKLCFRRA
ncbi:MAG: hypothetical protein R3C12_11125 [Planctomycetaceae bacterium]